jgi:hypothetical protein
MVGKAGLFSEDRFEVIPNLRTWLERLIDKPKDLRSDRIELLQDGLRANLSPHGA